MKSTSISLPSFLQTLPSTPADTVTDKYMFIDTKQVISDMQDLGFVVAGVRRPQVRTASGAYGLHEIDFRRPQDLASSEKEAPRILFMNSYDGSRKAQLVSGVIRFACSNGLVVGDILEKFKFLHLGNYAEELVEQIRQASARSQKVFDRIETYRSIELDRGVYLEFAQQAKELRFPAGTIDVSPETLLMPRRREDLGKDLWTQFNVLQENLIRGYLPALNSVGREIQTQPLVNIEKSNKVNQELWNLLENLAVTEGGAATV